MNPSYKRFLRVILAVVAVFFGVMLWNGDVSATGTVGDKCYQLKWYTTVTKTTQSANKGRETEGGVVQETTNDHVSNRVCYDENKMTIYAEEISNGEPMALGVQGENLCLMLSQDDGSYKAEKCTADWKTNSALTGFTVFDTGALSKLGTAAGVNAAQVSAGGVKADDRGEDFKEAAQLALTDAELETLRNVDTVRDVVAEQSQAEQSAATEAKEEEEKAETNCASSGAGRSLGWILCPILQNLSEASEDVYNDYVSPALQVDPQLLSNGEGGGARVAWETFRNIANVAFIILLLVVIFSQLTGLGIDNYGIKKILPKLIVGAVLINLSYLICILCVDLSNIIGNGIQALFDSLPAGEIPDTVAGYGFEGNVKGFASVGLLTLFGVGAGVAIIANPAILLSLLVSALGIVIAMFFLFILLAAREAAVIVLVAISPLAFVCFMLPNTKKYFDKWYKLGQAMLLLYPICGLMVGGGNYVSRLLLVAQSGSDESGFAAALMAMLVGVAPIFFIPSLLKGSFSAMGKLGTSLAGLGRRAGRSATSAIRGTEGYKNAQKMGLERSIRVKAGYNEKTGRLNALGRAQSRFARTGIGKLVGSNKRQAALYEAAKKNATAGEEATAGLTNALAKSDMDRSNQTPEEYYTIQFRRAAEKGDVTAMNSAISAAVSSGYLKDKDIAKMIRNAQNDGAIRFGDNATKTSWMRDTATKYGSGFLASDYEMRHWMQGGGVKTLGGYGEYAPDNIGADDLKPEDITRLSGDALAGMALAGKIDQAMAQRVIASNPNISADKKIMLGAIASGNANVTNANDFKEEAKALAANSGAEEWTTTDAKGNKVTKKITQITAPSADRQTMVEAWASSTPQNVNVVQNFLGGGSQIEPVDVNLRGQASQTGGGNDMPGQPEGGQPESGQPSGGGEFDVNH